MLEIEATPGKLKRQRNAGVELLRIRDQVAEAFANLREVGFESRFPLVAAVMVGRSSLSVLFAEATVLKSDDGRGLWIRIKSVAVAAHYETKVGEQVVGKNVAARKYAKRLKCAAVLQLACRLLDLLIGHEKL